MTQLLGFNFMRCRILSYFISNFFSNLLFHLHCNIQVRLEHILERITLISEAANTEKPSSVTCRLFIGGALAARSVYTLKHLGITHILCLCSNEIGQSDSQYPDLFEYKNFSVSASFIILYFQCQSICFYRAFLVCFLHLAEAMHGFCRSNSLDSYMNTGSSPTL